MYSEKLRYLLTSRCTHEATDMEKGDLYSLPCRTLYTYGVHGIYAIHPTSIVY